MAKVPEYERRIAPEGGQPTDSSFGVSEFYGKLRGTLSSLSDKVGAMADRARQSEGDVAGLTAGLDPDFRPGRRNTIYGQAYDRAGTRSFLDAQQNMLSERITQLSLDHENDPAGLARAIADLEAQTVAKLRDKNFPEAEVAFAGFFSRARTTDVRAAILGKQAKDKAEWLAVGNDAAQRRLNEIDRAGAAGGLDEENQKTIAGIAEEANRATDALVDAEVISPEEGRRRKEEITKRATLTPVIGAFDRLKTLEEKKKVLEDFNQKYQSGELGDMISGDDAADLRIYMEKRISDGEADRRAEIEGVGKQAKSITDIAAAGFIPSEGDLAALDARAAATNDPAATAIAEAARARAGLTKYLLGRNNFELALDRKMVTEKIAKEGATDSLRDTLAQVDKVKSSRDAALSSDPYAYGVLAGRIEPVPALSMGGSPDVFAATLQRRQGAQARLRESYGNVPFFTTIEKDYATEIASKGGKPALDFVTTIVKTLDPESARGALQEIATEAPVLANIGGLIATGGSIAVAQDAMDAIAESKMKDLPKVKLSDAERTIRARRMIGSAYLRNEGAEAAVRATANLATEKRLRAMGLEGDQSDNSEAMAVFERTLDEASGATWRGDVKYGGFDEVNGYRIVAPPDAREGEVETLLHRADAAALPPMGSANGVPITPRQLQGAALVNAGNGKWFAVLGDPHTPEARYIRRPDSEEAWTVTIEDLRKAATPAPSTAPDIFPGAPMMVPN